MTEWIQALCVAVGWLAVAWPLGDFLVEEWRRMNK